MTSSQNKYCFVQFKYNHGTSPGEDIHITGNIPSLGLWNVYKSEKMVTNQTDYPVWKSKENIMVQQDTEIQYKYLIFRGGKFIRWENNNDNRKVKIGKYYKVVIMDPGSKIIHCISDPNLNNITNSEISKCENNFYEDDSKFIEDEIDFNSIDLFNTEIISEQILNVNNNEEQFILSNKKNDAYFDNKEKKLNLLYEDLNIDNSNSFINIINNENNNILNKSNSNYDYYKIDSIDNIINETVPIISQIFNNKMIDEYQNSNENKELKICKIDSNISEIEKRNSPDNIPFIEDNFDKNELNLIQNKISLYQKVIICCIYLPVKIQDEEIIPLGDYIYPNLYSLKNNDNDNIYFIGFIKNYKNINEKKEIIYNKLKYEYKMYPIEIDDDNFKNEIFNYFNEIANPFLNNIKINIYNSINNNINYSIKEIHYKFNQIIYKNIIELAGNEKTLLLLFDHYFLFVPSLLIKGGNENELQEKNNSENKNNIIIQYLFLIQIPNKDKFIKIPNYQNIIKSLLYSNLISFTSYHNCLNFLNILKLIEGIEYQVNIDGDIILIRNNINEINKENRDNNKESVIKNRNVILKIENIFPNYEIIKYFLNENNSKCSEIKEEIEKITKNQNFYIFLSIDDIINISFIKIKILGLKHFIDDALDEKQKILFIQVITGESKNKNNIYSNININEEKQEKDNNNILSIDEIESMAKDINSIAEYKLIGIFHKDINIYEKLFLLNKADCFLETSNDINSPLSIYEYIMVKLIGSSEKGYINKNETNINLINNQNKTNKNIEKEIKMMSDYPIIEYIISSQIKEIPGINKYIYVNPFEIKSISNALTKAYRNLINCHKNNNNINFIEEHSKENDFKFIKMFFHNNKFPFVSSNNKNYQIDITNKNTINDDIDKINLNKLDINNITKDYSESIKNNIEENNNNNDDNLSINNKIIAINLDFFLGNFSTKKEKEDNLKFSELFYHLISISLENSNNKIILFSKEDQIDLDDIIQNYLEQNNHKFKDSQLNELKNLILASSDGYSFKKISTYFENEKLNNWATIQIDSDELKYSEKDIINNLKSYKKNCKNIKLEHKSNKLYIYNDDCNKEQLDIYMDYFKKENIEANEILKNILVVNKISNGYCIVNTFNYKALFISRLIKEIIIKKGKPKFILYVGFNQIDEMLYKYLEDKKSNIEKYSKEDIFLYCIKMINSLKKEKDLNKQEINYKNLFYEDNIDEIISLFKGFADLEKENVKKNNN